MVQAAACGAGRPGGGEMPPLPSPPVQPRPLGAALPPPPPARGCCSPGSPSLPAAAGWEGDGAPPPALTGSVAAPSSPVAGGREPGARWARGLVLDRPCLPLPWRREGRLARWGGGRQRGGPSRSGAGSPRGPLLGAALLPERPGAGSSSRAATGLLGRESNLCRRRARSAGRGGALSSPLRRMCLPPGASVCSLDTPSPCGVRPGASGP